MRSDLDRQREQRQKVVHDSWFALVACDTDVVLRRLADAFADNEAPASAVGVGGLEVSLVVILPPISVVPERKPTFTRAGNLSLKKLTKTESADVYKQVVFGRMVATLREAFAAAPGLESGRIVALRPALNAHGNDQTEVMAAGRCSRKSLDSVTWDRVGAEQVFNDCFSEAILVRKGATRALQPIPIDEEPELRALLDAVDMTELAG